jgi:hypothetical protein
MIGNKRNHRKPGNAMFDTSNLQIFSSTSLGYAQQTSENPTWFRQAHDHFERAHQRAWLRRLWKKLTRRSNQLLSLSDYALNIKSSHYAGLRAVSIDAIRGTEGRSEDFDDVFNPLSDRTRERWKGIFVARSQYTNLPPVELIQVGKVYFVRDGHHRISVARELGGQAIDAEVTVWNVEGPLPWEQAPAVRSSERADTRTWKASEDHGACAVSG